MKRFPLPFLFFAVLAPLVGRGVPMATSVGSAPLLRPAGSSLVSVPYVNAGGRLGSAVAPVSARIIVKLRDPQAQSLALALPAKSDSVDLAGVAATDPGVADMLASHGVQKVSPLFPGIVRAQRQQGRSVAQRAGALQQRFPARAIRAPKNEASPDLSSTFVFDLGVRSAPEMAGIIRSLQADPAVIYAEEDKVARAFYIPNDPSYSSSNSWSQGYDDLYGLKKIGTTQAWDTTRGLGVLVAVIDTGVDYNHPDISANIWSNSAEIPGNGIDDDHNGFVDDVRGWDFIGSNGGTPTPDNDPYDGQFHGTHVAGTIAATGDNHLGVVGVAWQAKIMPVKGLDDSGNGYDSTLAQAIVYAVDNGADVINASWGGSGSPQTIVDAIHYGHAAGVVFVAAAGNDRVDAKDFFPANVPEAIAVAALDPFDNQAFFSNFGSKVELAAPGQDILSLESHTGGYMRLEGTSMAAPHVSGAAALIIAQHPTFSNEQIRQALRISATDLGDTGKDAAFGYGRVNAAAGVLVNQVLEAKILSPADVGLAINSAIALTGTAQGPGFHHYVVDFGAGAAPATWTTLRNTTVSVAHGDIGTFNPTALPDGLYTVRLRAYDTGGAVYGDQIQIQIRYLAITSPLAPPVYSLTQEVKPGAPYQISGSARGPSFQSYVLEWAPGLDATAGWSTAGVVLAGGGLSPVISGILATWTPPGNLHGDYTVRLRVTNTGFSSTATATVYAEPSLVASGWPKFAPNTRYDSGVLPVRRPDGSWRLIFSGTGEGIFSDINASLYCYAPDGSVTTTILDYGSNFQPCVGELNGLPGDEILVSNGYSLKILASNLTTLATIPADADRRFGYDQMSLVDLDNDGVLEIIAPARKTDQPYYADGVLNVYRANGTRFSSNPLPTFTTDMFESVKIVAADLNGDGRKEIVLAFENTAYTGYTLEAFNADGTPYAGWAPQFLPGMVLLSLSAADLDHDGTTELIITEHNQAGDGNDQIRVVNNTGGLRPGWPVATGYGNNNTKIAIGDLDRDLHYEIVVADLSTVSVLRDNGTAWCPPWSSGGSENYNSTSEPVIADIDSDGVPEIIAGVGSYNGAYRYSYLTAYRATGTVVQTWPLFGAAGNQPYITTPLVGDFNGDGQTDLVASIAVIEGGGVSGWLLSSTVTYLTTGTPYNAARSDWTCRLHNPQNSRAVTTPATTSDLNTDGKSDIVWENLANGDRGFWLMNGTAFASWLDVGVISTDWRIAGTADFNGDGKTDILWENTATGDRGFWLMNGTTFASWLDVGIVSTDWHVAAVGDFNGDGKADILWENTVTGDRGFWLMNGTTFSSWLDIGIISTSLRIVGTADFNADGKTDIVWENTSTGKRVIWFMNGTTFTSSFNLGIVGTEWHIAALADYNGDGKPDILWENTVTGERGFWLMNGTTFSSWVSIGVVATDWKIAP